jgi:outer membrane murein-binding lipoprotein Lpp
MADDHDARIARLDAMIARARCLPSWPEMAAQLARLAQEMQTLKARVDALEQECEALRQRELIQLWGREA